MPPPPGSGLNSTFECFDFILLFFNLHPRICLLIKGREGEGERRRKGEGHRCVRERERETSIGIRYVP